jgi:hypothetical protein
MRLLLKRQPYSDMEPEPVLSVITRIAALFKAQGLIVPEESVKSIFSRRLVVCSYCVPGAQKWHGLAPVTQHESTATAMKLSSRR